jgi:sugar diacid utilization regulator
MSVTTRAREISLAELSLNAADLETSSRQPYISADAVMATPLSTQRLYDLLQGLVTALSHPLDELLDSLATLTRQVTLVDLCVVILLEAADGQMTTMTSSPDLREHGVTIVPLEVDQPLRAKLCDIQVSGQLPVLNIHEQERLNPLENVQYETLVVVPLITKNNCIGLINCYSSKCLEFPAEEQLLLSTIAMQASLAIQHHLLLDAPVQAHSTKTFFDDLLSGTSDVEESLRGRAASLGCDFTKPHVMVMLAMLQMLEKNGEVVSNSEEYKVSAFRRTMTLAKRRIIDKYPGSLLNEREHILFCIMPLDRDTTGGGLRSWLSELARQVEHELHLRMFAGISSICNDIADYRRGFAEAEEALQIGQRLDQEAQSAYFNDLGIYRYIYAFAGSNTLHDIYLEQIATIAHYDRGHKRTELLNTLELYLEHGGNIKDTSELLGVHRNTLTQRIERIQSLCSINIERCSNRLSLLAAIKIHRLRAPTE